MKHIIFFSGGIGSWCAAKRVREENPDAEIICLFADTLIEDEDLYRFLVEAADSINGKLVRISDGRTPWEVFNDERFLGNTRADPCSKFLKRKLMHRWVKNNYEPEECILYIGIDWTEEHRHVRSSKAWKPYSLVAPLLVPPLLSKKDMISELRDAGIEPPRLYGMGFQHNNCGGFCVKAGQAQFELLLRTFPCRYLEHERAEQAFINKIGKTVSILRDRRGGKTRPMTLLEFRERLELDKNNFDKLEWGGCGCGVD